MPELELKEKANETILKEFLETPNLEKLNKVQLEAAYATKQKEVEARSEFIPPNEKTGYEKAKSAVKAGAGYVVESQFGGLKELYGKKEEQTQSPVANSQVQTPEQTKVRQRVAEKTQHMQENLTQGKISGYKNSITPPQATKSASKKQESSRGL